jgi:phage terminase small subunit
MDDDTEDGGEPFLAITRHEAPLIEGLTPLQSAFVACYIEHGDGNATRAALAAGYAASSAAAMGYRLLRNADVAGAIARETATAIGIHAPQALKTMVSLLDAGSAFVRQQAAADLLNRAGHMPPKERGISLGGGGLTIDIRLSE